MGHQFALHAHSHAGWANVDRGKRRIADQGSVELGSSNARVKGSAQYWHFLHHAAHARQRRHVASVAARFRCVEIARSLGFIAQLRRLMHSL